MTFDTYCVKNDLNFSIVLLKKFEFLMAVISLQEDL